jgi:glycosyltransferase involved in cell wall biosynthesis
LLCESLARTGDNEVHLITGRPADANIESNPPQPPVHLHWIEESPIFGRWLTGPAFLKRLDELVKQDTCPVVIHDHGLWLPSNHAVATHAKANTGVRVVSPRGMLSDWALNHGRWKKTLIWKCFQHADLENATAFHATSLQEAHEIRSRGLKQPIAIIPNGVAINGIYGCRTPTTTHRCLFLSRIHPVKGLLLLLHAWKQAGPPEGWELVIAGPNENDHLEELVQATQQLDLLDAVKFLGPVDDRDKWLLYHSADLFILPSFSENFGIVIAESLAAGVPVITTTGTPWKGLVDHQAGWWIEPSLESVAEAIVSATSMPDPARREMGARGSRWVRSEFQWDFIAERMSQFYHWLLSGGRKPDFVH